MLMNENMISFGPIENISYASHPLFHSQWSTPVNYPNIAQKKCFFYKFGKCIKGVECGFHQNPHLAMSDTSKIACKFYCSKFRKCIKGVQCRF